MVPLLLACVHVPEPPPQRTPPEAEDPVDGDTGSADTSASPSGWGTCATLRAVTVIGGDGDQEQPSLAGRVLAAEHDGPLALDAEPIVPLGATAWFVAGVGDDGVPAWSASLQGGSQAGVAALAVAGDDVVVGGTADGLTTFAGVPLGGAGESDGFLARLDATGTLRWTTAFGAADDEGITTVAALPDGGVVAGGTFEADVVLGETALVAPPDTDRTGFLARYDAAGELGWAVAFGGSEVVAVRDVAADVGQVVAAGYVSGDGATVLAGHRLEGAGSGNEAFVAAWDDAGAPRWALGAGGGSAYASAVALGADGSVLAAGELLDTVVFARGEPGETTVRADEAGEVWLARLDPDGALAWVTTTSTPTDAELGAIAATDDGGAWLAGTFSGAMVLSPDDPARTRFVTAEGEVGGFLARYDALGGLDCAVEVPVEPGDRGAWLDVRAIEPRPDGGWDVAATVLGTASFGDVEVASTAEDVVLFTIDAVTR